ncbi:MAG: hypothetical protein ILO36_01385 [Abditibacteriota bacterium]|nr:hypothetical protein [Abditibacteriota bacterium]
MQQLNNPKIAIILAVVAAVLIFASFKFTKKVTHADAKSSIYLDEKDQEEMKKAFSDGSYMNANPSAVPAPPAPAGQ